MTDPHTLRVLEIADRLPAPEAEALCGLARALSPLALGHSLIQGAPQLGLPHQRGEQPVDRLADRLEAAGGTT